MSNLTNSIYNIRLMDELAEKKTIIHEISPVIKLVITLIYIVTVVSYGKYETAKMLPLFFYPVIIISMAELPMKPLLKRMLIAAPFVIGVGIFNPILDRAPIINIMGFTVTGGWISFLSIIIKCFLTVLAALMLLATTGLNNIALALRKLGVPKIFVLQIALTYRYITVLMEETSNIWNAYSLRAPGQKGVNIRAWGPLIGQMLIRTFDKAQRIYQAMALRGFNGEYNNGNASKAKSRDIVYFLFWGAFFLFVRIVNVSELLGKIVIGVKV